MYESNNALTMWQLRKVFSWSTSIIALSESLEQLTLSYFPDSASKVVRIPNPVSMPSDYPVRHKKSDSRYHILFLGYLQEQKGIRDLLQLEKTTREKYPDWFFDIAGKGELQELVETSSADFPSRIRFHGWADPSLREKLYRESDVFFLPSYVEGMPLGILEAMSYALPIVSTRVGGIPDIIGGDPNIGVLTEPGDVTGFVRALEHFYHSDSQLCQDRVNQRIRLFGEDQIYRQVVGLYTKVYPELMQTTCIG